MDEDKDFYKDIIDNLYDGVYFVDRNRIITYWNHGAERITGYTSRLVLGRSCSDNVLNHVAIDGTQLCQDMCPLLACMNDGQAREADVFLHHADGHRVPVLVRAAPLRDEAGNILGAVETFSSDVGEQAVRRELRELRRTVQTDPLTGVGTRRYMARRLQGVIAELAHEPGLLAGLLFIDIDHFKQINDQYGHDIGDKALRMLTATLRHNLRETDAIARWGGDEFLVMLYDVGSRQEVFAVAEKLRILVEHSRLDLEHTSLTMTISIGATLFRPADTPEAIIRRADAVMYRSKQDGRNRVQMGDE
jgi:diguanylate cyclase (GGDEF)-like protein/PAS domain S-box-containing protein